MPHTILNASVVGPKHGARYPLLNGPGREVDTNAEVTLASVDSEFVERQCQSPSAHLWCNGCTGYLSHQFGERQSSEVVLREEFLLKGLVDEVRSRTYQPSTSF